jgi:cytochrome P450
MFGRVATEDVELGGVTIRAGEAVFPVNHSANRDAGVFDRPDEFRIDRPDAGGHLGFGYGIHYCVGAPLARLELQCAFGTLLARFPTLRPAVPLDELDWNEGHVVRGLRALPVTW